MKVKKSLAKKVNDEKGRALQRRKLITLVAVFHRSASGCFLRSNYTLAGTPSPCCSFDWKDEYDQFNGGLG